AITIHKSQGLTFEKAIIDAENAFANGQVYVALSRCTSLEGLILTSPINQEFLGAHANLTSWQQNNYKEDLKNEFQLSRQKFEQQELLDIFSWRNWDFEVSVLNKLIHSDELSGLPSECFSWMNELMNK